MFTASLDAKRHVARGEIELAVDFTSLHCFEPKTGEALGVRRASQPV